VRINVKIDTKALKARTEREAKRLAFSTAQALNETAKEIQTAERVNLDRKFTVRKAGFLYRLIKITAFASPRKGRPFAEVAIDPAKKRVLLGIFERGGEKEPAKGKSVAVPLTGGPARPTFKQPVQGEFTFRKLRFRRHRTKTGKVQWKGEQRTFTIPGLGVLQRVGGKAKDSVARLIYAFQRRPHLKALLDFTEVAVRTFNREFEQQFRRASTRGRKQRR
jgi:hypothetical protein